MKTVRIIGGLCLLLNGALHVFEYMNASDTAGNIGILIFGIAYFAIGLLLFTKKTYPLYLGIFIPFIGMTLSIIKFGIPSLISLSALFKVLGISVIVCCIYVLAKIKKP